MSNIHEECGVFGIASKNCSDDPVRSTYFALYALQHRGQESCGIAVNNMGLINHHKDVGLVCDVFKEQNIKKLGIGSMAIGHVRYSTTGNITRANSQPLSIKHIKGPLALVHNGNIINAGELRKNYELSGAIFHGTSDSEVIAYTITSNRLKYPSIEKAIEASMFSLKGAYSMVVMSAQKMIACRDPNGFRPLCMGRRGDNSVVFSSESCALSSIGATFERDLKPGEIVVVKKDKVKTITTHCGKKGNFCVFEYVYFARPDSILDGVSVHKARLRAGALLAKEHQTPADVVIGVPDSGISAAMGYSQQSKISYGTGFIKNKYIGRSFIEPTQNMRENAVKIKLNVIKSTVFGKRVVMIDDSIVRGTTCARIVKLLREAGAAEIHVRISSPPFLNPCYFGTDIDSKDNLIACKMTQDEIRDYIGADSLGFLSVNGVREIAKDAKIGLCDGCFTGNYPINPPIDASKGKFESTIS